MNPVKLIEELGTVVILPIDAAEGQAACRYYEDSFSITMQKRR
ncbi:hypothetical protein [Methanoculleus taiwanensis]|nr:hypothetical protein [Methanoculleus taiwanensis]